MKLAVADVKQYRLPTVPAQKWPDEENDPQRSGDVFQIAKKTRYALGMDGFLAEIDTPGFEFLIDISDVSRIFLFSNI
jgi:hypothetical protein